MAATAAKTQINQVGHNTVKFKNEALQDAVNNALKMGFKVYSFIGSTDNETALKISQVFIEDQREEGRTIGSIQANFGHVSLSYCYQPKHGTGNGTGRGIENHANKTKGCEAEFYEVGQNELQRITRATNEVNKPWDSFSQYLDKNTILTYFEIVLGYETGAASHAVNDLILFMDTTRELAELKEEIYNQGAPNYNLLLDVVCRRYKKELGEVYDLTPAEEKDFMRLCKIENK